MKYGYAVKHDGVLYPAGADVPVDTKDADEKREETVTSDEEAATDSTEELTGEQPKETKVTKGKATK